MKRRKKFYVALGAVLALATALNVYAFDGRAENLTVQKIVTQVIDFPIGIDQYIIDAYVLSGWSYDRHNNQVSRDITYAGEEIVVFGEAYKTDSNGEIVVALHTREALEMEITTKSLSPFTDSELIMKVDAKKAKHIVLRDVVLLNEILAGMDEPRKDPEHDGRVQWTITYEDIEPSNGQTVHCNRFNGYLGNGVFKAFQAHPTALLNFIQSDCDVALANSTNCLADYDPDLSKRYCSTYSYAKAATCSLDVGHSRGYHKHTGFFSPSS
ncbi:MAG: hypothetical protein FWG91_05320 [Lachnospiraceae bacterium]|nr:hypothetical protein [Lachnospiraceae bacterium]